MSTKAVLKALQLDYFQSHKDTIIEFHEMLNVIVGTSNYGKSSIVRAIRWIVENQPHSDWLSWFAGRGQECSSAMEFSDEAWVLRMRKGAENTYAHSNAPDDPLHGFRKDVPPQVQEVLQMDSRNIKSQHDPYFMFQETPGEVARMLNRVVGNDDINKFFKRVDSIIDTSQREKNRVETDIKTKQEKLASLKWLDKALERVHKIEALNTQITECKNKRHRLETLLSDISDQQSVKKQCIEFLEIEPRVKKIKNLLDEKATITQKRIRLDALTKAVNSDTEYVQAAKSFIDGIQPICNKINALFTQLQDTRSKRQDLEKIVNDIATAKTSSQKLSQQLKKQNSDYIVLMKSAKICPWCHHSTKDMK